MSDEKEFDASGRRILHAPEVPARRSGRIIKPEDVTPEPGSVSAMPTNSPPSSVGTPLESSPQQLSAPTSEFSSLASNVFEQQTNDESSSRARTILSAPHDLVNTPRPVLVSRGIFLVLGLTIILSLLYVGGVFRTEKVASEAEQRYENAWREGKYKQVLLAAINKDSLDAQAIVLRAANGELSLPRDFRVDILSFGLNKQWRESLQPQDKRALLTYAGSAILEQEAPQLPALTDLHPGVLLAVAGNIGPQASLGKLGEMPLTTFSELPSPYGIVFRKLTELNLQSLATPQARAVTRVLTGHDERETAGFLVASARDDAELFELLRLVAPFSESSKELATNLLQALHQSPSALSNRVRWFEEPSGVAWDASPAGQKLFLVCGVLLDDVTAEDALVDLTLYPDQTIRTEARKRLQVFEGIRSIKRLIDGVSLGQIPLRRPQLVSLASLLSLPELSRDPYVQEWFKSKPEARVILFILLERQASSPNDVFNLVAAEYLSTRESEWKASFETLGRLTQHPEPLARSLAFGRLNPEDPEQREIMEAWVSRETQPTIKEQLQAKLSEFKNL